MSDKHTSRRLLEDVLGADSDIPLREASLATLLGAAAKKRRVRRIRQGLVAGLLLSLSLGSAWFGLRSDRKGGLPALPSCEYVSTKTLPVTSIVLTQPLGSEVYVATEHATSCIGTDPAIAQLQEIDDQQLLILSRPRIAALITVAPRQKRLVFLSADRDGEQPVN